ncbi:CHC2 zinc finger domain-containing protein [Blautia schinkii]|nr:CHC2 zinc finger domain-containing protein [Blautia schinkii]
MNVFEAAKQSVTTRQAAEHYGIHVNRRGMCVCPFHNDRNPSMKVDRRFYCFGCIATGDVIDFVSRLYGIGSKEAALMLVRDFSIPYEDGKNVSRQPIRPRLRRETEEQQFKRLERHCFRVLSDYYHLLRYWKKECAPHQPDEAWDPRFVESLRNINRVGYLLDELLAGDIRERASIIADYGKEVKLLERRMAESAARTAAESENCGRKHRDAPEH